MLHPIEQQLELVRGEQRWVLRYKRGDEGRVLKELAEMARNPEIDLDWYGAAVLSHQLGKQFSEQMKKIMDT